MKRKPKIKCPEHRQKRIYWGEGRNAGVILVGYCPDTLAYFQALANEAKKDFPDIDDGEIICSQVTRSSSIHGFTVILFTVPGEKREVAGWDSCDGCVDFGF